MDDRPRKPGKYGRAFDWRISHGSEEPLSNEAALGMSRLASSDFPDILEDFLSISRKRQQNPTALARLQIHMLEELLIQEATIKQYREHLAELESPTVSGNTEERQQEIKFAKGQRFFHRAYANAIRAIGDGIAWRAFGYDRAAMRLLGERETKQHLSSEGTVEELREWSRHFDTGSGIAILNALTNCLAIADVTVVRHDGSIEIVEVKSSKTKSSRKVRQKQAMNEVVTLLGTGVGQNEGRDVAIEILRITPETYLDRVEELLQTAGENGWAARRISDWLYVEAFDFRKFTAADEVKRLTGDVRKVATGEWERRGDYIQDMNSLDVIGYSPNSAPFSVFPFRARTCIDLLIGAKFYVSFLNVNAVEREFTRKGWTLEKDFKTRMKDFETLMEEKSKQSMLDSMIDVRKGPFHCTVTPADFMRMQIETLRPKTLIDAVEAKYRQGPSNDTGYVLALYQDEYKLWN
jgi:hypothetical protein